VIGRLLLRLVLVPLGAAMALAAAGALIVTTQWNAFHAVLAADPVAQQDYFFALMVAGPLLVSLMSTWVHYTFVPALAGVCCGPSRSGPGCSMSAMARSALLGWTLPRTPRASFFHPPASPTASGRSRHRAAHWLIPGRTSPIWKGSPCFSKMCGSSLKSYSSPRFTCR
jgi:hypothetical protein